MVLIKVEVDREEEEFEVSAALAGGLWVVVVDWFKVVLGSVSESGRMLVVVLVIVEVVVVVLLVISESVPDSGDDSCFGGGGGGSWGDAEMPSCAEDEDVDESTTLSQSRSIAGGWGVIGKQVNERKNK